MTESTASDDAGSEPETPDQRFERQGEAAVRAEFTRGGKQAFGSDPTVRKAASEWLAEREHRRTAARGTPAKLSVVGPVICAVLVIAAIALVASF